MPHPRRAAFVEVQPDPVSGMHCWHQAVRVKKAGPGATATLRPLRPGREAYALPGPRFGP